MDETTQLGTLWSQTLMEVLCAAVRKNDEAATRRTLDELRQKRYSKAEVRRYAAKNLDPAQLAYLERCLKTKSA